jgi:hypothetical protein
MQYLFEGIVNIFKIFYDWTCLLKRGSDEIVKDLTKDKSFKEL